MHLVISGPPTISHSGPPARAEALGLWLSEPGVPCAALPETAGPAARPATRAHRPPQGPPSSRSTHRRTHARTQPRSPTRLESPPRPSSQAAPQARPHMRTGTCSQTWRQRQKHTAPQPPVLPAGVTHAPGRGPALPPPAAPRGIPTGLPTGLPTRSPTRAAPQAGDRHLQDLPRAGSFPDVPSHLGAPASLSSPSILPVCLSVWCQDGREEMKVRSAHGGASVRRAPSMQLGLWALPTPLGAAGNSHQGVEPTGRPRRPGQLCNARAPPTDSQPGTRTWQGHPHSFLSPFPLGLLFRAGCGLTRGNQIGEREGGAAGSWVG